MPRPSPLPSRGALQPAALVAALAEPVQRQRATPSVYELALMARSPVKSPGREPV
jgi:hypothetical protein